MVVKDFLHIPFARISEGLSISDIVSDDFIPSILK